MRRGIDLFDCVMPTRNGRNAMAFTDAGPLRLRNLQYERDPRPLEEGCPCRRCRRSRGYLRHLFMAREMLGPILLSIHNLTYYQRLLAAARAAIRPTGSRSFGRRNCGAGAVGAERAEGRRRKAEGGEVPACGVEGRRAAGGIGPSRSDCFRTASSSLICLPPSPSSALPLLPPLSPCRLPGKRL